MAVPAVQDLVVRNMTTVPAEADSLFITSRRCAPEATAAKHDGGDCPRSDGLGEREEPRPISAEICRRLVAVEAVWYSFESRGEPP